MLILPTPSLRPAEVPPELGHGDGFSQVNASLFAPELLVGCKRLAALLETLGRYAPGLGAFQVLTIDKPDYDPPEPK